MIQGVMDWLGGRSVFTMERGNCKCKLPLRALSRSTVSSCLVLGKLLSLWPVPSRCSPCYPCGCLTRLTATECKESKACSPAKHHFDECVERVTGADHGKPVDKKHPEEDCVEECRTL